MPWSHIGDLTGGSSVPNITSGKKWHPVIQVWLENPKMLEYLWHNFWSLPLCLPFLFMLYSFFIYSRHSPSSATCTAESVAGMGSCTSCATSWGIINTVQHITTHYNMLEHVTCWNIWSFMLQPRVYHRHVFHPFQTNRISVTTQPSIGSWCISALLRSLATKDRRWKRGVTQRWPQIFHGFPWWLGTYMYHGQVT
jgi:hypothetical protein